MRKDRSAADEGYVVALVWKEGKEREREKENECETDYIILISQLYVNLSPQLCDIVIRMNP